MFQNYFSCTSPEVVNHFRAFSSSEMTSCYNKTSALVSFPRLILYFQATESGSIFVSFFSQCDQHTNGVRK